MRSVHRAALVLGTFFGSLPAVRAYAQPVDPPPVEPASDPTAEARELFFRGLAHVEAREWRDAADSFRRALELRDAPAVRYNLAAALVELSEFAEADRHIDSVLNDPSAQAELKASAETLREQLRSRAATITLELDAPLVDATVTMDGRPFERGLIGVPVPYAPGLHEATVERNGNPIGSVRATVAAGESVTLRLVAESQVAGGAPTRAGAAHDNGSSGALGISWWWWGAAGGAAVVAGVVMAVLLSSEPAPLVAGDFEPGTVRIR